VERILAAVRAELPRAGMLGMVTKGNEDKTASLIQALSGTPLPAVRALLREVADKHARRKTGEAAAKALRALDNVGKPPPPAPGLSGDLELFGLPNLLQTLGQSQFSGVLTIMDSQRRPAATLIVEKGVYRGGQCGTVKGTEAVYQLLERPFPGTFAFVTRSDVAAQWHLGPEQDVLPLILEGVRRYDEFNRAAAVAPDHVRLKPSGKPHSALPDEDPAFAAALWQQLSTQRSVLECEVTMAVDSYRVRRVVAHWIEEGSLQTA
jgi:hypothetical protein